MLVLVLCEAVEYYASTPASQVVLGLLPAHTNWLTVIYT